jgi:1,4-alpha-glucan branching enzyme
MDIAFEFRSKPGLRVYLVGSFNAWCPTVTPMYEKGKSGHYGVGLKLARGRYAYKFVSAGQWFADPLNPDTETDSRGGYNSLLEVG